MVKSKSKSKTRLSNIHKPVAMSLVEWQVALRRQQAQKETLVEDLGLSGEPLQEEPDMSMQPASASSPSELIGQGVAFLGNLLQTLKQPDSARELVDALVKEDPDTGQTTLQIPVSGKDKVLDFVTLLGKLLK